MLSDCQVQNIIGRNHQLFEDSLSTHKSLIDDRIGEARILVIGAAGSIGSSVTKLLCSYNPLSIYLIDINENALASLVRDLRVSGCLNQTTELKTYLIDVTSSDFASFSRNIPGVDYVFNLSAVKHVRSESNVFSLARMIRTNVISTYLIIKHLSHISGFKYFCVSTDKAANPVNLMGFTKLIMEDYCFSNDFSIPVSSARFANVAFSNGSLLESFISRFSARQPLIIPGNIKRFFISKSESAAICLLSAISCDHRQILFPNSSSGLKLISFEEISRSFLSSFDLKPHYYSSFDDALSHQDLSTYPVFVSEVDTTGEKPYEEFFSETDAVSPSIFTDLDIVTKPSTLPLIPFEDFYASFNNLMDSNPSKHQLVSLLKSVSSNLSYSDFGKYLDDKI